MKNFKGALVWLTLSEVLYNASGYIIHAALARILSPEDYGRYGVVITLTTMLVILIGNGIPTAMSKYLSEVFESAPGRVLAIKRSAAKYQAMLMLGVTVLFAMLAPAMAWALRDISLTPLLLLSSLIIPAFALASFYFSYFTGLHAFHIQAALKAFRSVVRIVAIVALAYLFGIQGSIAGYIVAPLLVFVLAYILAHRYEAKQNLTEEDQTYHFDHMQLFRFAGPLVAFLLVYELTITMDLYLVKALLQNDLLTGIYNAALNVARIPYFLFYALTIILLPAFAKLTADQALTDVQALVTRVYRLMYLFLIPLVALIMFYARELVVFFAGERYESGAEVLPVLTLGIGLLTVFYVFSFAWNGSGHLRTSLYAALAGLGGLVAMSLYTIPHYGLLGAAYAVLVAGAILAVLSVYYNHRLYQVWPEWTKLFEASGIALLMVIFAIFLPAGGYLWILSGAAAFGLYLGLVWLTGVIPKSEAESYAHKLSKKMGKK